MSEVQICDKIKKYRLKRNYDCRIIVCVNRSSELKLLDLQGQLGTLRGRSSSLNILEILKRQIEKKKRKNVNDSSHWLSFPSLHYLLYIISL